MLTEFNKKISEAYNSDDIPRLESLSYSVKKHTYEINYGDNDKIKKKQKTELIAKTFDKQNISRNSYRDLCAIEFYLPSEKLIYQERQAINKKMAQFIPISIIDIINKGQIDQTEEADIDDEFIVQEVVNTVGKGGYRSIKNILQNLIPNLVQKGILKLHQPIVNLRISGDGRNVG